MFVCPLLYVCMFVCPNVCTCTIKITTAVLCFALATFFAQEAIVFVATGIASISHGSLTVFSLGVKGQYENYFLS